MHRLKKITAGFLILLLMSAGCAQKDPSSNTADSAGIFETAAENAKNADAKNTADPTASTKEPEPILLEHDLPLPDTNGTEETLVSIVTNGPQGIECSAIKDHTAARHRS